MEIAGVMTDKERQELVADLKGSLTGDSHIRIRAAYEIERLVKELASFKDAARAYSEECDSKIADLKACIEQAERERDAVRERLAQVFEAVENIERERDEWANKASLSAGECSKLERERDALIERIAFWQEYAADKRLTEKLAW